MSDFIDIPVAQMMEEFSEQVVKNAGTIKKEEDQVVALSDILRQMEAIQKDTKYLSEVIEKLSMMQDGDSGTEGCPGNVMGQAKAQALGDIVRCRETTNQRLLKVYEKMYDDRSVRVSIKQKAYSLVESIVEKGGIGSEDKREMISNILAHMAE